MFASLRRDQKEAVGLLQIGTFLEYFDLMLYVHMAVLLNELFFPKTDPHTASLIAAAGFCATYVFRPFGALIFGHIGDNIGRRITVIITTMMMAVSCIIMANLPTYAQIGITASWAVTICRIIQGLSSMGEIMGAQIYLTEITKPPLQYKVVSIVVFSASLGTLAALGIATLVINLSLDWRIAFWVGACIAVIGTMARTRLRETPEFVDMKRRKKIEISKYCKDEKKRNYLYNQVENSIKNSFFSKKDFTAYLLIECGWPLAMYLSYIYFSPVLKAYGYSGGDIISHNFFLSIFSLLSDGIMIYLSSRFFPLKILTFKGGYFLFLMILFPFLIPMFTSPWHLFIFQGFILICPLAGIPADSIFIRNFHVAKRFTSITLGYAISRACVQVVTAFGLIYITEWFGYYGIWVIALPICIGFLWGVNHFKKLENKNKNQIHTPDSTNLLEPYHVLKTTEGNKS